MSCYSSVTPACASANVSISPSIVYAPWGPISGPSMCRWANSKPNAGFRWTPWSVNWSNGSVLCARWMRRPRAACCWPGRAAVIMLIRKLRAALREVTAAAGITARIVPHQFRHTYGTEMLRAGVGFAGVMKLSARNNVRSAWTKSLISVFQARFGYGQERKPIDESSLPKPMKLAMSDVFVAANKVARSATRERRLVRSNEF